MARRRPMPDDHPVTTPQPCSALWATPEFRQDLSGWVASALGPCGPLQTVRARPWSSVWRVDAEEGAFYVKQNCPSQYAEADVLSLLAGVAPEFVVPVRAADPEGGRLITPDSGSTLRSHLTDPAGPDEAIRAWTRLLVDAASLQRTVLPFLEALRSTGLTVMATEDAPTYVERMIDLLASLSADDPRRLPEADAQRLVDHLPTVRRCVEQVGAVGLPMSLNHNDLHDANALIGPDGGLRFFDFGDAVLADPLGMLLIPLRFLAVEDDWRSARYRPVIDQVLEVWSDLATVRQLRAALPAALHLARLARVEAWWRVSESFDEHELGEFGGAAAAWLTTLVEEPPEGL